MIVPDAFISIPTIVLYSAVLTLVVEALTWLLVYRTNNYRQVVWGMEKAVKELEVAKPAGPVSAAKATKADKSKRKLDKTVKNSALQMFGFKMKILAIQFTTMASAWWVIGSYYKGRPVGQLPFDVPVLLRGVTHHNLQGEDFRQVSFTFVYMLCYQAVRYNITKALALGPSRKVAAMIDANTQNFMSGTKFQ